jgi:MSHA biogenesis protein MshE
VSVSPQPKSRYLTSILLEAGLVTEEQIEEGLFRQRATGHRIGETLVEMGAVTEESIGWALARQFSLVFVDLPPETLDAELVRLIPEPLLRRLQAVPLVRGEAGLSIAVSDPTDAEALSELVRAAGCALAINIATPSRIHEALDAIFGTRPGRSSESDGAPERRRRYDVLWDRSGATFLEFHLANAGKLGASEIHFIPDQEEMQIAYRLGGELVLEAVEPSQVVDLLAARVEALGGPVLGEGETLARGRFVCRIVGEELCVEAAFVRGAAGPAVTLFPVRRPGAAPPLEDLGVEPAAAERLRTALRQSAGLVLVAGPPRSGGSTTLSALLAAAPEMRRRVLVFEPGDTPYGPLATRVRLAPATAREKWEEIAVSLNPDAVVLDGGLGGDAVRGALSDAAAGRLLLARTDWADSFDLLAELAAPPRQRAPLARRLLCVVQQRLVRVTADGGAAAGATAAPPAAGFFPGRAGLFEFVFAGDKLRRALLVGADAEHLRAAAGAEGFRPLSEAVKAAIAAGRLAPGEAARALT